MEKCYAINLITQIDPICLGVTNNEANTFIIQNLNGVYFYSIFTDAFFFKHFLVTA